MRNPDAPTRGLTLGQGVAVFVGVWLLTFLLVFSGGKRSIHAFGSITFLVLSVAGAPITFRVGQLAARRLQLRLHLSTLVVLSMVWTVLVGLNLVAHPVMTQWGEMPHFAGFGFPLTFSSMEYRLEEGANSVHPFSSGLPQDSLSFFIDCTVCWLTLLGCFLVCELVIARRRGTASSASGE